MTKKQTWNPKPSAWHRFLLSAHVVFGVFASVFCQLHQFYPWHFEDWYLRQLFEPPVTKYNKHG